MFVFYFADLLDLLFLPIDGWIRVCSEAVDLPICHGEQGAKPKDKALDLTVELHSHLKLLSLSLQ